MGAPELELKLSRYNRVYSPGETVAGQVNIVSNGGVSHNGINIKVDGAVQLQLSANAVGVFEAFSSTIKPVVLLTLNKEVQPAGKLGDGTIAIPFEFVLDPAKLCPSPRGLLDTYHGVYISVQYTLTVEVLRSGLFSGGILSESTEFIVEVPTKQGVNMQSPAAFLLTSETVKKSRGNKDPGQRFTIKGQLNSSNVYVQKPLAGYLVVHDTSVPIKQISLQLIRVETICAVSEGTCKEASEVQSIMIAQGNVMPDVEIPIHVVLPRLFSAPSINWPGFQLDFEANIVVEFENGFTPVENIPLKIYR